MPPLNQNAFASHDDRVVKRWRPASVAGGRKADNARWQTCVDRQRKYVIRLHFPSLHFPPLALGRRVHSWRVGDCPRDNLANVSYAGASGLAAGMMSALLLDKGVVGGLRESSRLDGSIPVKW
jgi:hypothetical protein